MCTRPCGWSADAGSAEGWNGGVDYYEIHVKAGHDPGACLGQGDQHLGASTDCGPGKRPCRPRSDGPVTIPRLQRAAAGARTFSIHNHGHNVGHDWDGHPRLNHVHSMPQPARPATFYDYHYPNTQQGGTPPQPPGAAATLLSSHDHVPRQYRRPHVPTKASRAFYNHPSHGRGPSADGRTSICRRAPNDISADDPGSIPWTANKPAHLQRGLRQRASGRHPGPSTAPPHPSLKVGRAGAAIALRPALNAPTRPATPPTPQPRTRLGRRPQRQERLFSRSATERRPLADVAHTRPGSRPRAPPRRADIIIDFSKYKIGDVGHADQ